MKNKIQVYLYLVISLCVTQSYAQEVKVTTENVDGNIVFNASLDTFGSHTLVLEFTEVSGLIFHMRV